MQKNFCTYTFKSRTDNMRCTFTSSHSIYMHTIKLFKF